MNERFNHMTYIRHALATAEAEGLGIEDLIEAAEEEENVRLWNDKVQELAFPLRPKIISSVTVHFYEGGGGDVQVHGQEEEENNAMTDEEFEEFYRTCEPSI